MRYRQPIMQVQIDRIWAAYKSGIKDLFQIAAHAGCSREAVKDIIATKRRFGYDARGAEFEDAICSGLDMIEAGVSVRVASINVGVRYNEMAKAAKELKNSMGGAYGGKRPNHVRGEEYSPLWYSSCNTAFCAAMQEHYPGKGWTDIKLRQPSRVGV